MTTNGSTGYIAVLDGNDVAGQIVYWRLSGTLDAARLAAAWEEAGLDREQLPGEVTASTALHRAMRGLAEKRRLVRPLEGHRGWALVEERAAGDDLAYDVPLRAYLGPADQVVVAPEDHAAAPELRAAYDRIQREVSQNDVSGWLCRLMAKVEAVGLRDTGGVYFVPRHTLTTWSKMVGALRASSSHTVFGVPAMRSEETVAAVVDAVTTEAERECDLLEAQIMESALGERALESRMARTNAAEAKLARYEAILGQRLDTVRERLERARAMVSAAILTAAAPEQTSFA